MFKWEMKRSDVSPHDIYRKRPRLDGDGSQDGTPRDKCGAIPFEDWGDDDFLGDQIEEVCVFADTQVSRPKITDNGTSLLTETQTLKESLKTREGEVAVLRSQLDRLQRAKQKDSADNKNSLLELQRKTQAEVATEKKRNESLRNELEFKELEIKELRDKCKQLEIRSPKIKFVEPELDEKKTLFSLSQAISVKSKRNIVAEETTRAATFRTDKRQSTRHDGVRLTQLVASSFFESGKEPNVAFIFSKYGGCSEYKWTHLPLLQSRIQETYPLVMELYQQQVFKSDTLNKLSNLALDILVSLKNILIFLQDCPTSTDHDRALLEDVESGSVLTIADILSKRQLKSDEVGIDGRRCLGLMSCVVKSCPSCIDSIRVTDLLECSKLIIELIGRIRRPVEFTGALAAALMFVQALLESSEKSLLDFSSLQIARIIIEQSIFLRPKLDVLRQALKTISCLSHHPKTSGMLCKQSPAETCTLYMDSYMRQAMFFKPNACPIKLIQHQIKTLAHLTSKSSALLDITQTFCDFFHSFGSSQRTNLPNWLVPDSEQCCDITECFTYLLYLCLPHAKINQHFRTVIEKSVITLRNCCKGQQRKLTNSSLKLFPPLLRGSGVVDMMSPRGKEASSWLLNEYDYLIENQELTTKIALDATSSYSSPHMDIV